MPFFYPTQGGSDGTRSQLFLPCKKVATPPHLSADWRTRSGLRVPIENNTKQIDLANISCIPPKAGATGLEPATSAVHVFRHFRGGMDYIFTLFSKT